MKPVEGPEIDTSYIDLVGGSLTAKESADEAPAAPEQIEQPATEHTAEADKASLEAVRGRLEVRAEQPKAESDWEKSQRETQERDAKVREASEEKSQRDRRIFDGDEKAAKLTNRLAIGTLVAGAVPAAGAFITGMSALTGLTSLGVAAETSAALGTVVLAPWIGTTLAVGVSVAVIGGVVVWGGGHIIRMVNTAAREGRSNAQYREALRKIQKEGK